MVNPAFSLLVRVLTGVAVVTVLLHGTALSMSVDMGGEAARMAQGILASPATITPWGPDFLIWSECLIKEHNPLGSQVERLCGNVFSTSFSSGIST